MPLIMDFELFVLFLKVFFFENFAVFSFLLCHFIKNLTKLLFYATSKQKVFYITQYGSVLQSNSFFIYSDCISKIRDIYYYLRCDALNEKCLSFICPKNQILATNLKRWFYRFFFNSFFLLNHIFLSSSVLSFLLFVSIFKLNIAFFFFTHLYYT